MLNVDDPAMLKDPKEKNSGRVSRGGTAGSASWWTRSSMRAWDFPATPVNPKGFRPVLSVASVHKALQEAKPADAAQPAN